MNEALHNQMMGNGMFGMYSYGWIFHGIILLLFFLIIYWVLHGNTPTNSLEILKRRYAKGQITKKEFLKLKKEII